MSDVDVVVVGAGVVGLAVARELAQTGLSVIAIDAAEGIGTETSSRNSEVIHAGIYYPAGSLKARFCVEGKQRLYAFCDSHGVAHRRSGKLIVATSDAELTGIEALARKGAANGVEDLRMLDRAETLALEPALSCTGALLSPSTGIVDSHAYMLALQGDAEEAGAAFAFHTPFSGATPLPNGEIAVRTGGAEPTELTTRILVNAAGLHASKVARAIEGLAPEAVPETRYVPSSGHLSAAGSPTPPAGAGSSTSTCPIGIVALAVLAVAMPQPGARPAAPRRLVGRCRAHRRPRAAAARAELGRLGVRVELDDHHRAARLRGARARRLRLPRAARLRADPRRAALHGPRASRRA